MIDVNMDGFTIMHAFVCIYIKPLMLKQYMDGCVRQADNLRQQTLQQMHRVLTTHQAARGLLAMGDYFSRLRALSSLWIARPRE